MGTQKNHLIEHPNNMFKLMGKEMNAVLGAQTILIWTYEFPKNAHGWRAYVCVCVCGGGGPVWFAYLRLSQGKLCVNTCSSTFKP